MVIEMPQAVFFNRFGGVLAVELGEAADTVRASRPMATSITYP